MPDTLTVGELLIRIKADVTQLERGLNAAQNGLNGMSNRTRPGLQRLENALLLIGTRAVGIQGPIGSLSRVLLQFAGGGLITAGVIAGLGAIALAWQKLTKDTLDLKKAAESAAQSLMQLPEQVAIAQAQLAVALRAAKLERERQLLTGEAEPRTFGERFRMFFMGPVHRQGWLIVSRLQKIVPELATLQSAFAAGTRKVTEILIADESALAKYFDRWEEFDASGRLWAQRNDIARLTGEQKAALLDAEKAAQAYFDSWARWDQEAKWAPFFQAAEDFMREFAAKLPKLQIDADVKEAWQRFGFALGDYLTQGIEAAVNRNLGSFLKGLLFTGLRGLIFGAISTATGGTFATGFFAGTGIPRPPSGGATEAKLVGSPAVPIASANAWHRLVVDFSNMPQAATPMAAARDAQWQRFIRESFLVAQSQGAR